jgi:hypothetical protein
MPFSGRNPGSRNIYIHTGDSGQGITNGVAGSLTIPPSLPSGEIGSSLRLGHPMAHPATMPDANTPEAPKPSFQACCRQ